MAAELLHVTGFLTGWMILSYNPSYKTGKKPIPGGGEVEAMPTIPPEAPQSLHKGLPSNVVTL